MRLWLMLLLSILAFGCSDGECKATKDEDCRQSKICKGSGLCKAVNGECKATEDEDCQKAEGCEILGLCTAVNGECLTMKDKDCQQSILCKRHGWCTAVDGECKATQDEDCRQTKRCKEWGYCTALNGKCKAMKDNLYRNQDKNDQSKKSDKGEESKASTTNNKKRERRAQIKGLPAIFRQRKSFSDQLSAAALGGDSGELVIRRHGAGEDDSGLGKIHGVGKVNTGKSQGRVRSRVQGKRIIRNKLGQPKFTGGSCDKSAITHTVRRRSRATLYCYEKQLQRDYELQGEVTLKWIITLDGRVKEAFIEKSDLHSGPVENCLIRAVKRWKFPRSSGDSGDLCEVSYPFIFNPGF